MTSTPVPALRVEPARADDAGPVAAVWLAGWREAHLGRVPDELVAVRTPASFSTRAAAMVPETLVAVSDDRARVLAGFVVVHEDEVDQLYTDRATRRAGVGSLLLRAAEERIAGAGHRRAWLAVVAGNTAARAFYERHGWRDEGLFDHRAAGPDGPVAVPSHRYVKDLD